MTQFVTEPTRFSTSGSYNILDLILSNNPMTIDVNDYMAPLSTSDHIVVDFSINPPIFWIQPHCRSITRRFIAAIFFRSIY